MSAPNVEDYLGLVAAIAIRLCENLPVCVELEELKSAGAMGLIDAAQKYNPAAGVSFPTYAKYRIRGAMLDSLRDLDWMSRDGRRLQKRIETTVHALRAELGRDPDPEAIAEALELPLERYLELHAQLGGAMISSDAGKRATEDGETIAFEPATGEEHNPERLAEKSQARAMLQEVTATLPARYQLVVELYYGNESLTFKEIGDRLGVNESRVSQIHKACIEKLEAGMRARGIHSADEVLS